MRFALLPLTILITVAAMASAQSTEKSAMSTLDPHSAARPDEAQVTHIDLDLTLDFDKQQVVGDAIVHFDNRTGTDQLWLDTRGLQIKSIALINQPLKKGAGAFAAPTEQGSGYTLNVDDPPKFLGHPLSIEITPATRAVRIHYATSDASTALQWLTADQTSSKKQPFLYTQSQAIHARSWIPCQDSPGIRLTYTATVRVPPGMMAVMSAENATKLATDGVYYFQMDQPIPAYLFALAAGDLQFRAIGTRTGVYAEPTVVDAAAYEFAETERMMAAAEKLYGPYRWDRYDLLVLPPSFPFGGMENPRLTFATPTVLTGDRSLVSLIAHELAHSWSGNLVTNATWNDFWLNEGFTVYFEHRIMESIFGPEYAQMLSQLGKRELQAALQRLPPRDTWLKLDLADRDPDEGLTEVAYEKGFLFLRMLEEAVGRPRFDAFLRDYFDTFAFQSVTTEQFLTFLNQRLLGDDPDRANQLRIDEWVYGPGLPDNCPQMTTDALGQVAAIAQRFAETGKLEELPESAWTTHHWLHFLRSLPKPLPLDRLAQLDERFHFSASPNSEITHDWLLHAIAANYEPAMPRLEQFLCEQGRRKFLRPLYEELAKTPDGLARARSIYRKARPTYHAISTTTIDGILQ